MSLEKRRLVPQSSNDSANKEVSLDPKENSKSPLVLKGFLDSVVLSSGMLKLQGWVLLEKKINELHIYINDVLLERSQGFAFYGRERRDIEKLFPMIKGSLYSGVDALYHLDQMPVPKDGLYTIRLRAIDNEGQFGELTEIIQDDHLSALATFNEILMGVDAVIYCSSGTMLIIGWIDDRKSPLSSLSVFAGPQQSWKVTAFGRLRRLDVESTLFGKSRHLFGFWAVVTFERDLPIADSCVICGQLTNGQFAQKDVKSQLMGEIELRNVILAHLADAEYFYGDHDTESFLMLDRGAGSALIDLNQKITASIVPGAWVSYYGPTRKSYSGSVIVCLFGKKEFLFLQSALFSLAAGFEEYEFVFVSNSPELAQSLEKEAQICARIYGVSIVLVCLSDNAGFGAANNVAAKFARSKRLMFTNPDVFPRDNDWARRHTNIIMNSPKDQTLIFGAPLYYDDGSLMHHGIYFNIDAGVSVSLDKVSSLPMVRTEHYGKGSPVWSKDFVSPRPVPAITGAFMSIDRDWFETIGGFNEEYLFGHYEDVDLCLKSLAQGKPVWIHDFPMWHMEGKGSVRQKAHEGGSVVNRWLFTHQWGELIARELLGPKPTCPALQYPGDAV